MTEVKRTTIMGSIGSILSRVPVTAEEPDNVVEHPSSTLDQMERRVRDLENELVVVTADLERLGLKYMTLRDTLIHAQTAFCERLKDSGIKAEPVRVPPALEM
jgi:hypothetical protein